MKKSFTLLLILIFVFIVQQNKDSFSQSVSIQDKTGPVFANYSNHNKNSKELPPNRNAITVLPEDGSVSSNGRAPQGSRLFINTCYLIKPSEIIASGFGTDTVTSVGWTYIATTPQNISTTGIIAVYLQNTTDTIYGKGTNFSTAISGMTKVIVDTITIPNYFGTFNLEIPAGGPGTSEFITNSSMGVYVAFEYQTISTLATPLGSPTIMCNIALNSGCGTYQSQSSNGTLLSMAQSRPKTEFGNKKIDSVKILALYALGLLPFEYGTPDTLGIRLKKSIAGSYPITLRITVQKLDTPFVVKDTTYILVSTSGTFDTLIKYPIPVQPSAFTNYTIFRRDRIIVDALAGKLLMRPAIITGIFDTKDYCQYSTYDAYNHADPCDSIDGGIGINNSSGNIVARFNNYSSQIFRINYVDHSFYNVLTGNQPYRIVVYGDNNGVPGTLLYSSSTLSSPGLGITDVTHQLSTPLDIAAQSKFYVGIRQQSTTNIGFSFQNENPVRTKSFFYSAPENSSSWTDFSTAGANYRLNISPRMSFSLFDENFDYTAGDSIGAHGWTWISDNNDPILVTSPGLTFTDYSLSGIGNAAHLKSSGNDNYKALPSADSSGSYYASFMVKVDSAKAKGDYFIAFLPNNSFSYKGRALARLRSGNLNFGITKGSSGSDTAVSGIWTTENYSLGVTYLLVLKYTFVPGNDTNDQVSLFVFSSAPPEVEPSPTIGPKTFPSQDASNIGRIALRQAATAFAPVLNIDGIQINRYWNFGTSTSATLNLTLQIESMFGKSDTARVYIASSTPPYNFLDFSKSTFNTSGIGTFSFDNIVNGANYYLVFKHRNSIETWSSTPKTFSGNQLSFNFTTSSSTAFGGNLTFVSSKWCIYTGDVNQDGAVELSDLSEIDNDAFNFVAGYVRTDLNGDDFVDLTDLIYADNNANDFVIAMKP